MSELHYHTPLQSKPRRHAFCAFDVEGVGGTGGFWCGAVVLDTIKEVFRDQVSMWRYLVDGVPSAVWRCSHNLEYDLSVLNISALLSGGATMGEGGLLWYDAVNARGEPVRFVDSLNLFRELSAADLGTMVDLPKLELPAGFLEVMRYGYGFELLDANDKALLQDYNLRDAEIVYRAMNFLQDWVNQLGGELRETIAATSHDLYRRVFMPHPWCTIGPNTNETARAAFYGGRVEPYRMQVSQGVSMYDVNSLYPSVMAEERFPDPGCLDMDTPSSLPSDLDQREGVIAVNVTVPECYCPPLPVHVDSGLFFPTGSWDGVYTLNELRHALSCGVSVNRVDWIISTRRTFNPFADFVHSLWERRQALAEAGSPGEQVVKMLLNSHIGRYGVRSTPPLTTLEIVRDRFDPVQDQGLIWDQIGRYDYIERPIGDGHRPTYSNVFFAAQVSAGARVKLHREMLAQGGNLVYVDTDAIMTRGQMPVGKGLGEWKCLLEGGEVDIISPKEYTVMMDHYLRLYKAKGVPPKVAVEYLANGFARYQRALSLRQARVGNRWPGSWVETYQQRGSPIPKRDPAAVRKDYTGPIKTRAWRYSDLLAESAAPSRFRSWSG